MITNYFQNCHTPEEAKSLYHRLALQYHPDRGGDLRTMQEINAQYAAFLATHAKTSEYQRQAEAHKVGKKTAADYHNMEDVAEVLRVKIEAALNVPGITVELCGLWVWLTGETKAHCEEIKSIGGFRYAHEKQAWYFAAVPSFNRQKRTLDEIRHMHGSQVFSRQPDEDQPAGLPAL
ncbi:MAG: J domain-containing protein [Anaerolineales bacterium]|jgi:curved DNA-binding protein CbpA